MTSDKYVEAVLAHKPELYLRLSKSETVEPERPEENKPGIVAGPAQPVQNVKEDGVSDPEKVQDGKTPGEDIKETSGGGKSDPDSAAIGDGGSGGAETGTAGSDGDSAAIGDGPSGGA